MLSKFNCVDYPSKRELSLRDRLYEQLRPGQAWISQMRGELSKWFSDNAHVVVAERYLDEATILTLQDSDHHQELVHYATVCRDVSDLVFSFDGTNPDAFSALEDVGFLCGQVSMTMIQMGDAMSLLHELFNMPESEWQALMDEVWEMFRAETGFIAAKE